MRPVSTFSDIQLSNSRVIIEDDPTIQGKPTSKKENDF